MGGYWVGVGGWGWCMGGKGVKGGKGWVRGH